MAATIGKDRGCDEKVIGVLRALRTDSRASLAKIASELAIPVAEVSRIKNEYEAYGVEYVTKLSYTGFERCVRLLCEVEDTQLIEDAVPPSYINTLTKVRDAKGSERFLCELIFPSNIKANDFVRSMGDALIRHHDVVEDLRVEDHSLC